MKPPEAFFEEYQRMRQHMRWAEAALGRGQDEIAQARTVLEEFREFHQRWHPVIQIPELREGIVGMMEIMESTLGRGLEKVYLSHLHEVIEARKDWWMAELLLPLAVKFIRLMKSAPPPLRAEMEKIHREKMGKEFDPTTHYQDSEREAAEDEADFRKALAALAADWPERVDAPLRERLERLDGPAAQKWQVELSAQLEGLED